jgi:hypothetical protein
MPTQATSGGQSVSKARLRVCLLVNLLVWFYWFFARGAASLSRMLEWFRILIGALRSALKCRRDLALENLALRPARCAQTSASAARTDAWRSMLLGACIETVVWLARGAAAIDGASSCTAAKRTASRILGEIAETLARRSCVGVSYWISTSPTLISFAFPLVIRLERRHRLRARAS